MGQKRKRRMGREPWVSPEDKMVGRNFTLTPQLVKWLEARAGWRGLTVSGALREVLQNAQDAERAAEGDGE